MEIHHFYLCPHKPIRLLSLVNHNDHHNNEGTASFIKSIDNDMYSGIPLFLAKDVLDGICIQGKNHARIHSRFAKEGVAVRLDLSDFGIEGISNSKSVYFYNIKGLFQAVFEYHNFEVQRGCLLKLRDLWLTHDTDLQLPETIRIKSVLQSSEQVTNIGVLSSSSIDHQAKTDHRSNSRIGSCILQLPVPEKMTVTTSDLPKKRSDYALDPTKKEHSISFNEDRLQNSPDKVISSSSVCSNMIYNSSTANKTQGNTSTQEYHSSIVLPKNDLKTFPISKENKFDECSIMHTDCSKNSLNNKQLTVLEHLEQLLHDIKLLQAREKTRSQAMTRLANTLVLLNFIKCEIYGEHFNPQNSFPIQLLEKYLKTVEGILSENHFGIPCRRETALCIISDWLGKQFHRMEPAISAKVDQFKEDHIACIDNLPPPESIIKTLFPVCMTQLISNWIGQKIENGFVDVSDHDYGPPQKRIRGTGSQEGSLYPVIQLLLEFANNTLVSGVAHVVYSRLRHSS
ncbi:hypothetical protein ScPMuIL_005266 [Solemya velum]